MNFEMHIRKGVESAVTAAVEEALDEVLDEIRKRLVAKLERLATNVHADMNLSINQEQVTATFRLDSQKLLEALRR